VYITHLFTILSWAVWPSVDISIIETKMQWRHQELKTCWNTSRSNIQHAETEGKSLVLCHMHQKWVSCGHRQYILNLVCKLAEIWYSMALPTRTWFKGQWGSSWRIIQGMLVCLWLITRYYWNIKFHISYILMCGWVNYFLELVSELMELYILNYSAVFSLTALYCAADFILKKTKWIGNIDSVIFC
jgi:hypothetical protein